MMKVMTLFAPEDESHEKVMTIYFIIMTLKDSHECEFMFEKIMYKVKDNNFRIRDFTSGDHVNEDKFVEGVNQKGNKQLQAQVCVLFKDDYVSLNQELESLRDEVQRLKRDLNDKEMQIKTLEKQVKESKRANIDEVMQLKEDKFNIAQEHDKEVSKLHQEISNLEKSHLEELEQLKETHANEMLDIHEKHKKEIDKLNEQYNAKLDEVNDKLLSEVKANKQASDNLRDEMSTMTKTHEHETRSLNQDLTNLEKGHLEDMKEKEKAHSNEILELTKAHQDEVNEIKEELSQVKQEHLVEINEKDKAHSDECEKIRHTFLGLITNENTHDRSEIKEIKKSVPSIFKPFMKKTMSMLDDFEEKKQSNAPEKIVKTYELSGEKEKEQ